MAQREIKATYREHYRKVISAQAQARTRLKHRDSHGYSRGLGNITAYAEGRPRLRTCQWIEGEPTAGEDCKCNRPVLGRGPYCEEHEAGAREKPGSDTAELAHEPGA